MIKVIMRDGAEHEFDQIMRERTGDGILTFWRFGEAQVTWPTSAIAEIHIRERSFAVAAE